MVGENIIKLSYIKYICEYLHWIYYLMRTTDINCSIKIPCFFTIYTKRKNNLLHNAKVPEKIVHYTLVEYNNINVYILYFTNEIEIN